MERSDFYEQLHSHLAKKYNIPHDHVETIRSLALGNKLSREDIMDWADEKLRLYKSKHWEPRKKWKELFDFLEDLSDKAWEDIAQKTEYDK